VLRRLDLPALARLAWRDLPAPVDVVYRREPLRQLMPSLVASW
jgi:hypothetical protein